MKRKLISLFKLLPETLLNNGITFSVPTTSNWKANLLLLTTALIWGFSFVAQRQGMEHVSPFTFNAARFAIGTISLIPIILISRSRQQPTVSQAFFSNATMTGGFYLGVVLFAGASLQQIGIVETTAGKAGFITGLYVIIVPLLGLLRKQKTGVGTWFGAILAVIGMYFLSATDGSTISEGDFLILISALFWAVHVQLVSWLLRKFNALYLSLFQFFFCSLFSCLAAVQCETITIDGIQGAMWPILYTGIFSVGIAYTLQIVAQQKAHPAHAAIILSLESVFAALGGYLFLNEIISMKELFGCSLMLTGMILSQLLTSKTPPNPEEVFDAAKKY
jgi:drug/metabolite transporter (DMT)-like permease